MNFEELNLNPLILRQIKREGFLEPTPIQEKCIPEIKAGHDVVGHAMTGSGKTVAFSLPILEGVTPGRGIQALILTPTRELCLQVKDTFDTFGKHLNVFSAAVYGGVGMGNQIQELRRADIVVATPGRLLDHMERRTINLSGVHFLVLDEVDRMFDMGFIDDVDKIIRHVPANRQTLLFSATVTRRVHELINKYLKSPVLLKAETLVDKSLLKQIYYVVEPNEKFSLLVHLLKAKPYGLALIFCATRHEVDRVVRNLKAAEIKAMAIHGGLTQPKRMHALESLKKEYIEFLVATDVAARGLDIKNVMHVFNYDVPKTSDDYIHRIGRTARAGKNGEAVTLLTRRDFDNFRHVLSNRSLEIIKVELPEFERLRSAMMPPKGYRETPGHRPQGHGGGRFSRGQRSGRRW